VNASWEQRPIAKFVAIQVGQSWIAASSSFDSSDEFSRSMTRRRTDSELTIHLV
jgi:hypothetical protein